MVSPNRLYWCPKLVLPGKSSQRPCYAPTGVGRHLLWTAWRRGHRRLQSRSGKHGKGTDNVRWLHYMLWVRGKKPLTELKKPVDRNLQSLCDTEYHVKGDCAVIILNPWHMGAAHINPVRQLDLGQPPFLAVVSNVQSQFSVFFAVRPIHMLYHLPV